MTVYTVYISLFYESDFELTYQRIILRPNVLKHCIRKKENENSKIIRNPKETRKRDLGQKETIQGLIKFLSKGRGIECSTFCDVSKSVIYENIPLTELQKLLFLKIAQKGETAHWINHLFTVDGNYTEFVSRFLGVQQQQIIYQFLLFDFLLLF